MPSAEINNVWATQPQTGSTEFLELPSGQIVKARRIALHDLIAAGVMSEADTLTMFVQRHHLSTGRAAAMTQDDAMKAAMDDPNAFGSLMMMVDRVVPHIAVEPGVRLHFEDVTEGGKKTTRMLPPEKREAGWIYTDQVPFQDKIFLMSWGVGDITKAQPFRGEPEAAVAGVADGADLPHGSQRPPRNRKGRKR